MSAQPVLITNSRAFQEILHAKTGIRPSLRQNGELAGHVAEVVAAAKGRHVVVAMSDSIENAESVSAIIAAAPSAQIIKLNRQFSEDQIGEYVRASLASLAPETPHDAPEADRATDATDDGASLTGEAEAAPTVPVQTPAPNVDEMRRHMEWLVLSARENYPGAFLEIAWSDPGKNHAVNSARLFGLSDLGAAATHAEMINARGCNVYLGATLKKPEAKRNGRTSKADYYVTTVIPVDVDEGAADVAARLGELGVRAGLVVTTGRTPELRQHRWFRLTTPLADGPRHRNIIEKIIAVAGGDNNAKDFARVMRLAGSVSYPPKAKTAKGYIVEQTTLEIDDVAEPVLIDSLEARLDAIIAKEGPASEAEPRQEAKQPEPPRHAQATSAPNMDKRERACGLKALMEEAAKLAAMGAGQHRNAALNTAAIKLGHQAAAGRVSRAEVYAALHGAMQGNGWIAQDGQHAFDATFNSGFNKGLEEPAPPLKDRPRDGADDPEIEARVAEMAAELDAAHGERRKVVVDGVIVYEDTGEIAKDGPDDLEEFRYWIVNQTREDPGAPYRAAVYDRLRAINGEAPDEWERIAGALGGVKPLDGGRKFSVSKLEARFKVDARKEKAEQKEKKRRPSARPGGNKGDGAWGEFEFRKDGLHAIFEKGSAENPYPVDVWVSAPFEIIGRARDVSSNGWGKVLRWTDDNGCVHNVIVSDSETHGDHGLLASRLSSQGLTIDRDARNLLARFISRTKAGKHIVLVDRTGWHRVGGRDVFVLPKETIAPDGAPQVMLRTTSTAGYAAAGSLEDWRSSVARLANGQTKAQLAIAAALAGPLLYLVNIPGCGIHFQAKSSKGKTTLILMVASVYGKGIEDGGFIRQWRATANGLEAAAAEASDTTLALDEVGQIDGRDFAHSIYSLANGVGKQRADRNGDARASKTWRVLTISTGEMRVGDKIAEDGRGQVMAGQEMRLIDIQAVKDEELGVFDSAGEFANTAELATAIKEATAKNYGTAGPEFVRRLIDENVTPDNVVEIINRFVKANVPPGSDAQIGRAAKIFGLIAAAGEIGIYLGVLPWEHGSVEAAAASAFQDWIVGRGGIDSSEEMKAIALIRGIIEQHGASRFEAACGAPEDAGQGVYGSRHSYDDSERFDPSKEDTEDAPRQYPVRDRLGWVHQHEGETEYLFAAETWKKEVCRGIGHKAVTAALIKHGYLRMEAGRWTVKAPRSVADGARPRVYAVSAGIMSGGGDE